MPKSKRGGPRPGAGRPTGTTNAELGLPSARKVQTRKIVNYTPHVINIYNENKELVQSIPSSGVARCNVDSRRVGFANGDIPIFEAAYGDVAGLPRFEDDVLVIVSLLVKQANPNRIDLVTPGYLLRDDQGQPIGCIGLNQ